MSRKKQSRGVCVYCGQEMAKGGMIKHLSTCTRRRAIIEQADHKPGKTETIYHLRVQDAGSSDFWLDLEMCGRAKLKDLDYYLRGIWLECCGHLSQFSIGGWGGEEIAMKRQIQEVFEPGVELTHIYDFGTSSETLIKAVGVREGKPNSSHPIALMARNIPPEERCMECERPGAWLCIECLIEEDVWGTLCDTHVKAHPHEDYGEPLPLVNSPRLGMCGYSGPAEPPY
ncbi:MAG: hypothetical protein A3G93_01635 [Nitrospinae bacterium RIFCSPLOWO2_12_FULL_45_22]|nr:MAG: hypothetical protein A3G93_01635 [Nitrospinae bacterium RIFCSPLOWO2_12_FULL_45_22]